MQLLEQVRNQVTSALSALTPNAIEHASRVSVTRDSSLGDYQANVVFALSKELGRNPEQLAGEIAARLRECEMFDSVEVAGKGFINMRLTSSVLLDMSVQAASDGRCGVGTVDSPRTYIVDYSSPNVAKPMHVGHIRSTVIGDAITRTLRFVGHNVITDNHLGDWGTQFGMIIYGYKHFVDRGAYDAAPVLELSRLYRLVQQIIGYQAAKQSVPQLEQNLVAAQATERDANFAAEAKKDDKAAAKVARAATRKVETLASELTETKAKIASVEADSKLLSISQAHPEIEAAALRETAAMHAGNETNLALWKQFMPYCLEAIETVYDALDVKFDHQLGESFYHDRLAGVVEELRAKGLAKESEGAICVFLDGFDAPMIVQKQDGAYLYATTDLATAQYRMEEFNADAVLYVVDHRQSEHFQKFFAALKAMGYELELRHISFGTVLGNDGKPFKTRSGDTVGLESLLQEAIDRARAVVCDPERLLKASLQMDATEQEQVATAVGLGAIKYADLSHNRTSDYVFDLEKMVALEGNTATYIQYSYARCASILKRITAEQGIDAEADTPALESIAISHLAERSLLMQLLRFEEAVAGSLTDFQPSVLADYLFDTSKQFASFFDQCHVIKAESETAATTRRLIVNLTRQVLAQGLALLGISVVERM